MNKYPVYESDNWYYSEYVSRPMGINCFITLNNEKVIFCSVQPANNFVKENFPVVGYIELEEK